MKGRSARWGVSGLLAVTLVVTGCTEPTQDPMAALVAAETVMAAIDGADAESALQAAIDAVEKDKHRIFHDKIVTGIAVSPDR